MAVDTSKDVYSDDEAPAVQELILNGERQEIPWEKLPEGARYFVEFDDRGGYRVRVPIVRVEMSSLDERGRPAPPEQAKRLEWTSYGLNPRYTRHTYGGHDH